VGGLDEQILDEQKRKVVLLFNSLCLFVILLYGYVLLRFKVKKFSVSGGRPLLVGGLGPGLQEPGPLEPPKSGPGRYPAEIVPLYDRLTRNGYFMSSCCTCLSATVCEVFRVLWFSHFRPEVVSVTRGRGRPKATLPFDSSIPLLFKLSVDTICLSLSVQKLFEIFILA
jgi:hypothetical protein